MLCVATVSCVTSGTHEAVLADLANTQKQLGETQSLLGTTTQERDEARKNGEDLEKKLGDEREQNLHLVAKVESMGASVEQLAGEKSALAVEIDELRRMRASAEARSAEYRSLLARLSKMIDAGTLKVKIRGGRMVVEMSSDVVFPAGGTRIKPQAEQALQQLAKTILQFPDRRFQVVGHSDPTPISTSRFPSNWELSSQRAVEVVKLLIGAGVPPEILSAAGQAEFDPLVMNDTPENQAANRRVEIVFMPKLSELPGFDEKMAGGRGTKVPSR